MPGGRVKARLAAVAVAAGLVLGLTGCGMVTPVATNIHYDPSDGSGVNVGELHLRNLMVVTSHTEYGAEEGSLVFTAVNPTSEERVITMQYGEGSDKQTVEVTVAAGSSLILGVGDEKPITITNLTVPAGGILPMYVQSGSDAGRMVNVPVLDTTLAEYEGLAR
ncbi:MAG TPA: hypothetical protein VK139_03635 [Microbacteriaceae bacterium]|nr:hypothetical protein [Microbacteriaceae bacterium]